MNETGKRALTQYVNTFAVQPDYEGNEVDTENYINESRAQIQLLILQFLSTCKPEERFANPEFTIIISKSANMEGFDPGKAAEAFKNLENYILLLYWNPWKSEFHKLKVQCLI